MDKNSILTKEEEELLNQGRALYDMTQTQGWQVVSKMLTERMIHTWVDPRSIEGPGAREQWEWQELNAFHSADVAKQLLNDISELITRAEYLEKKRNGEIKGPKPMKI